MSPCSLIQQPHLECCKEGAQTSVNKTTCGHVACPSLSSCPPLLVSLVLSTLQPSLSCVFVSESPAAPACAQLQAPGLTPA